MFVPCAWQSIFFWIATAAKNPVSHLINPMILSYLVTEYFEEVYQHTLSKRASILSVIMSCLRSSPILRISLMGSGAMADLLKFAISSHRGSCIALGGHKKHHLHNSNMHICSSLCCMILTCISHSS